jgi:hypothetical protein
MYLAAFPSFFLPYSIPEAAAKRLRGHEGERGLGRKGGGGEDYRGPVVLRHVGGAAAARSSFGEKRERGEMGFRVLVYMAAGGLGRWSRVMGLRSVAVPLHIFLHYKIAFLANFFFSLLA